MKIKTADILFIPKEDRNQGRGTRYMKKICGWADVEKTTLVLSADSEVCGRAGSEEEDRRLVGFYGRFGFVLDDSVGKIYTDTVWTDKNIMVRQPEPVLSDFICRLADLQVRK